MLDNYVYLYVLNPVNWINSNGLLTGFSNQGKSTVGPTFNL